MVCQNIGFVSRASLSQGYTWVVKIEARKLKLLRLDLSIIKSLPFPTYRKNEFIISHVWMSFVPNIYSCYAANIDISQASGL